MASSERLLNYKNRGKSDKDEIRRKREVEGIQLRKQKRDEQVFKRRNINVGDLTDEPTAHIQAAAETVDFSSLGETVASLLLKDSNEQLRITQQMRKVLSKEPSPPINEVIQTGAVPVFVEMLRREDCPKLQFEAAWALTNIASGTSEQTAIVVKAQAIPLFVSLLSSQQVEIQEQAVWALGNISGDGPRFRDIILDSNVISPLIRLANVTNRVSMTKNVIWTISNLCRGKVPPPDFEKVKLFLPVIGQLLFHSVPDILADGCWALSYLSDGPNERIQAVIDSGVCRRVVELLMHSSDAVVSSALRTVGNIVTGDDVQTQVMLHCSALVPLQRLLSSSKESIVKESSWTISNITAGDRRQIQQVLDANIFPALIGLLSTADFKTRKEAAWAITNATSGGTASQIRHLVELGCIRPMCDLLAMQDLKILSVALNGLQNILRLGVEDAKSHPENQNPYALMMEECGGLDKLEFLQSHDNNEVYQKTFHIIETYFGQDEDS